ncbi:2Fe-2S iron-sulfur cluster-binding protein [Paenibacillus thalictri]|uniref:2Fe-2S iron-sulfur cluster binding domain-containing protein n=1 Tax=Paenibacillus thalictri TaxID=2527873 RepID=A0A4Q9DXP1_9BACL|nr:2Fe-2S iron-sulfur cluster-binding protein [Paenibacillus thalictri]TBL80011.1 2Fe-2S iron-sulfur cluster binding domain-containing protein [Paenibacillus thalictri]
MPPEITFLPDNKKIGVRPGTTVLDAGKKARVHIRTRCGAKAACLMCKVIAADPAGLSPLSLNEKLKLGGLEEMGYRLACQAKIVGNATVTIPEDPLKAAVREQLARMKEEEL